MSRADRAAAKVAAEKAAADRLAGAVADRSWTLQARCREADPALFSPVDSRGRLDRGLAVRTVEVFCRRCPVAVDCLTEAYRLAEEGVPPQELVQAGLYWPSDKAANPAPVNLLSPVGGVAA